MKNQKTEQFTVERYLPTKMREGGEEAYTHKSYPKVEVEHVGHRVHLWTKVVNRRFEWKGEWVCQICGVKIRSQAMPPIDAIISQMSSPSINTLIPIGGKTVVEDIKKMESITDLKEGTRRMEALAWRTAPGGLSKEYEDGTAQVYVYIGTTDAPPPLSSPSEYTNWAQSKELQINNGLVGLEFWIEGWPVHGRVEIFYPAKINQMEVTQMARTVLEAEWALQQNGFKILSQYAGPNGMVFVIQRPGLTEELIRNVLEPIKIFKIHGYPGKNKAEIEIENRPWVTGLEQPPKTAKEDMNIHMDFIKSSQKNDILHVVSKTGHAIFEDNEKCPKCGKSKIEIAGDSHVCQMCGEKYKKKVAQNEDARIAQARQILENLNVKIGESWEKDWGFGFYASYFKESHMTTEGAEQYLFRKLTESGLSPQFVHYTGSFDISIVLNK